MKSRAIQLTTTTNQNGKCILYVMSRDQRMHDNHALLAAQAEALQHKLPLIVGFTVLRQTGHRKREQYQFMVDGLKKLEKRLRTKNIPLILTIGAQIDEITKLSCTLQQRTTYFDFSPLRGPRAVQKQLASQLDCRVIVVDTHNIVPVWVASDKEEFAAHTLRRKLHKQLEHWIEPPLHVKKHLYTFNRLPAGATWSDIDKHVATLPQSGINHGFASGEAAAHKALKKFIETGLDSYAGERNDPAKNAQSDLSPYLHYGQISSLRIILSILESSSHPPLLFKQPKMPSVAGTATTSDGIDAYIEELVVRKELSDNFCYYNSQYDSLDGARDWAKTSLAQHANDPREFIYTLSQLEKATTHDDLWNAAQTQLTRTGKMHGYMRMYWAKMILQWTTSPKDAVKTALYLNDKFHLDGGDPNGYVGVLWSIAGLHDRPWFERDVFGKIRYMSANGARKKFDTKHYIAQWCES